MLSARPLKARGGRGYGRPKITWKRTVTGERMDLHVVCTSWSEVEQQAQDCEVKKMSD